MDTAIKRVTIEGLHDQYDMAVELLPGLNIIYGKNGTGKTTFLHVLANLLDGDISRFLFIGFRRITVDTNAGNSVQLDRAAIKETRGSSHSHSIVVSVNGESFPPISRGDRTPLEMRNSLRQILGGRPVYLPAFRSVLEAISGGRSSPSVEQSEEFRWILEQEHEDDVGDAKRYSRFYVRNEIPKAIAHKTILCREWFGPFVPVVRFPSLWEVSEELLSELQDAKLSVAAGDREAFSGVFVEVLRAITQPGPRNDTHDIDSLLGNIKCYLADLEEVHADVPPVYQQISSLVSSKSQYLGKEVTIANNILAVYEKALGERSRAQKSAFKQIATFESSVNKFLSGKKLTTRTDDTWERRVRRPRMITLGDGRPAGLSVLSSGERHVLTLLFSATHMAATDGMLLIDEPELSLHVGWQRIILRELMKQAGNRQIIACTHAPEVAAHHREEMVEVFHSVTRSSQPDLFTDGTDGDQL